MKRIILSAMILLMISCSTEEEVNNCGCYQIEEIKIDKRVWTGGAYMYTTVWVESGESSFIEGCYTIDEASYMTRQVSDVERWILRCNN